MRTSEIRTIALGMVARTPIQAGLEDLFDVVDDILLVEDTSMLAAMKLIHQHAGIVVEPSGASGIAALLQHMEAFLGGTVAAVLCGGSITADETHRWLSST